MYTIFLRFRLAQIIILLFATAIFLSYAIQFYVPLEILLPAAKARFPRHESLVDYGLRYALGMSDVRT